MLSIFKEDVFFKKISSFLFSVGKVAGVVSKIVPLRRKILSKTQEHAREEI